MVRTKQGDGIKSNMIISEVQKRPCLFDTNHPLYGDRAEKARSWEEVCETVVPGWSILGLEHKFAAGKEVQKRWRSIRDSFTKAYRQGKCIPEQCALGSRRYQYRKQMAFLLRALQNKKPRLSQDKYDSFSEVSNSPQHLTEDLIKSEINFENPLNLKKIEPSKAEVTPTKDKPIDKNHKQDKRDKVTEKVDQEKVIEMKNPSLEIKIDANSILPEDHFDDDKLFMHSLIPLFKKMDDDTRLLCRIEVLKIIRFALQGNKCFEALRVAEDSFFKSKISAPVTKEENVEPSNLNAAINDTVLSMAAKSTKVGRPVRKRKIRSPSPLPTLPKKRGPGRPRKIRPPLDSDEDDQSRVRQRPKPLAIDPRLSELDEELRRATSVAQLKTPVFMRMYNLERSKNACSLPPRESNDPSKLEVSVKSEPIEPSEVLSTTT